MPYDYLTINEEDLSNGSVSASYFSQDLQSLYEQQILNVQQFFGDTDDDILELSVYNSNQEPLLFNRVIPKTTYSVVQGSYRDINGDLKKYNIKNPITNYAIYGNELLLHTQFDLKINELNPGLYYVLYNPIRNIAGNAKNRLFIKEISPSRTELRLSFAFNTTTNESNRLDSVKISSFADKKFVFLQIIDTILPIVDKNPVEKNFTDEQTNFNYLKYTQLLGLKSIAQLQEFINSVYVGYNKIINLSNDPDTVISANSIFVGVADQIKNFIYTYNDVEFSRQDILEAVKIIVTKVCQDAILQKTSLTDVDLQETLDIFNTIIYDDWLNPKISELLTNYENKYFGIYKNALNFDSGKLVKILTHTSYLNPIDGRINVQIKLDSPLPSEYSIKDTCWISNISLSPIYFKTNLYTSPVSKKVYLNGVNFTVNVPTVNASNEKFSGYQSNTIFAAKSRLQQKINDLLINYDDFSNFINFSSAELRSKIAKNKILKYSSLETSKLTLQQRASSQTNTSISASYSEDFKRIESEQVLLLDSFDEYESYLFYNTSSINNKIEDGVQFDKTNYNSLFYQLPEYIKDSSDCADYLKFTTMVGHFFDNILVFIKKFPKSYPIDYNDNNTYPKNYIEELLNSFNWNVTNDKFNKSDLQQLLFNNAQLDGNLSSSYFDYAKSIFNRITNNLNYIYKTKGTSNSFNLIRSIFGVSSDLINVVEYTSPDILVSRDVYYDFDDIVYMTRFKNNQYLNFNFTGSEYSLVTTSQWSAGSTSLVVANQLTRSCQEIFTGVSTVETTFRLDQPTRYDFQDRIPIIKKLRNKKVDWQVYLKKSKQKQSANLIFELTPIEAGITSSISTIELPYLNGDFFTFMVTREPDHNIQIDSLNLISQSNYNNTTQSFTSSAAQQYIPHIYKLSVNQYYGSQLNFSDTKTKTITYSQNKYFSSGSYYVANYSSSNQFYGNIDKIKIQKLPLSDRDFNEHSYNLNSISIPEKDLVYSNLYYLWSFDTPINLYGSPYSIIENQNGVYNSKFYAYNFDRNSVTRGYPNCDVVSTDTFPYQFEKFSVKQAINSNRYGPNYKANANINKITQTVDSNLVPYEYSSYTNDVLGSDSNLVGYYISPYQYLNSKIEDFLGDEGISDIIGDPKYLTARNYPELKLRQKQFAETNLKYVYPQENYSTYKFYIDFSIFDFIKKLSPTRSTLKTGLLLEPSLLERVKFNYKDVVATTIKSNDSSSLMVLNSIPYFDTSLIDTNDSSSYGVVSVTSALGPDVDRNTYNFSRFEIKDRVDDRDFIFAKYGKYIYINESGYNVRDTIKYPSHDYYQSVNNDSKVITFKSSYDTIQIIGSGSGLTSNQVTGSKSLPLIYNGSFGSGYSHRHLSKFVRIGTRVKKQVVSGSKYAIINGVKTLTNGKLSYYPYTKGRNTRLTTVNRKGLPNGSSPIISVPGFLSVDIENDNFPIYGTLTGSIDNPTGLFLPLPLTCSTCTSASLNTYIMNL
jgi:hypothetical protein